DLAGTIVEIGAEVKRFKLGDRVWASNQGLAGRRGTFSELVVVDECWLHPIPAGVKNEDVVAVSLTGITAHLGLVLHAKLKAGETVFVNGGTGGVGSCTVQIAKILGARVIATAGCDGKVEIARQLGANLAINYKTQDVDAAIKSFAPEGVNLWWETQREPNFERVIPLLSLRGRMVVMAGRDAGPAFPVGPFYTRDCSVHGFAMFNSPAEEQRAAGEDINRWLAAGKLKARIDRVLPLSEAAQAHRLQEESTIHKSGALAGKIVLKP
ncbi:MAG TPA: NADPH:quinone reductase, partial [Verrucomicrobiae bacterium]|nr:NADPH:quinone reductase [Verrucomicrobiae bacterium]